MSTRKIDWMDKMLFQEEHSYDNLVALSEPEDDDDDEGEYEIDDDLSDIDELADEDLPEEGLTL